MNSLTSNPLHRIPTLYSLYRPLIKLSKSLNLTGLEIYIKQSFKRNKKLGSLLKIQSKLNEGYGMLADLHQLTLPSPSSNLLSKYISLSHFHTLSNSKPPPSPSLKPSIKKQTKTSAILFSTPYSPPLPRFKLQPIGISMMICNRRKAIQGRRDMLEVCNERRGECEEEERFLEELLGREGNADSSERLGDEWRALSKSIGESKQREWNRNNMLISPELSQQASESNVRLEKSRAKKFVK